MKVEIENLSGHNKKLTIEVPAERVSARFSEYYKDLQQNVTLKGFRKGKAPLNMIREMYGDSATSKVVQNVVEEGLREALNSHDFAPITLPEINVESVVEAGPLKFTATFENTPPVELKNYTSPSVVKKPVEVTAEELEKTLGNVQDRLATFEDLAADVPAANGHYVQLDYKASEAGAEVPEATENDAVIEIGSGSLFAEFEANILGLKTGESKSFTVKFPMPEKEEERLPVSGRTLDFDVSMKGVRQKVRPELTDELAVKIGPFKDVGDLKSRIEEDLRNQKQTQYRRDLQEQALSWLIEQNPVETPDTLVNRQMEQLAVDAGMQLSQMGLDEKSIEERLKGWGDQMHERALRQIKASLLLGAIAKKENIQAVDEDIRQEITRIAVQSNRNPKDVLEDLQKRGLIGGLIKQVTELKALDWVLEKAM